MKRVKKKHVIVTFLIAFVVLGVILSVQLTTLSVYGKHGTDTYAVENSTVESKEFMGGSFNNYAFYYQLSTDIDRDNEIQIFANSDNVLFRIFGIEERYKHYISATSDKKVGSVCFSMPTKSYEGDINKIILYFSNNKDKIRECVYQFEVDGEITEIKEKIQPNYGFTVLIPYITNHQNTIKDIKKVSFYDENGKLVFEDVPEAH